MSAIEQIAKLVRELERETNRHATDVYVATDVMQKLEAELDSLHGPVKGVHSIHVLRARVHERATLPPGVVISTLKAIR